MLKDLIIKNRSYRGYDAERKVTTDELREMVECVRISPSTMNAQPLKFRLVNDEAETKALTELVRFAGAHQEWGLPLEGTEPQAYIVIAHDTGIIASNALFLKDVGIAGEVISLAATEMGLNACMIGTFNGKKVCELLSIPETIEPKLVVALGKGIENIELVDMQDGDHAYYRDETGKHFVPKRSLEDLLI